MENARIALQGLSNNESRMFISLLTETCRKDPWQRTRVLNAINFLPILVRKPTNVYWIGEPGDCRGDDTDLQLCFEDFMSSYGVSTGGVW